MSVARSDLRLALFDLDGTLIDSIELILRSYVHTLRAHDKPEMTRAQLISGLGTSLYAQLAKIARDADEVEAMVTTYRAWNHANHDAMVTAYPGAIESLQHLVQSGVRLGIVTSKARAIALRGLDVCGFDLHFDVVIGHEDVERHKPDPTPVLAALEHSGVAPEHAVYVGDSPHDIRAGNGAGVRTAAAEWGPFPRDVLAASQPDVWLAEPGAISGLHG